jgi:GntR family transcriptional regulator
MPRIAKDLNERSAGPPPELKPLYAQIKEMLVRRLVKGEWGPGEQLPSEFKLASHFRVHQGTVRKALDEMASEHLVVRQQGKGTFVADATLRHQAFHFLRLRPKSRAKTLPSTEFLSCTRVKASAIERRQLGLTESDVVRLVKIRRYDGKPIILERISIRGDVFPELEDLINELRPETTYTLLEQRYRVLITRVTERLSAVVASAEDARLLGVDEGSPLLKIERIACALDGASIEWRISLCRTEAHEYVVELT